MQPTKQKTTVELLDKGQFIITYFPDGIEKKIKGRFTMVAFDRFCTTNRDITYFELIQMIGLRMRLGDYADLLLYAFQDYYRTDPKLCPVTREMVLDIIDELGGVSEKFMTIIKHAVGRIAGQVQSTVDSPQSTVSTDKKKVTKKKK